MYIVYTISHNYIVYVHVHVHVIYIRNVGKQKYIVASVCVCVCVYMQLHVYQLPGDPADVLIFSKAASSHNSSYKQRQDSTLVNWYVYCCTHGDVQMYMYMYTFTLGCMYKNTCCRLCSWGSISMRMAWVSGESLRVIKNF